MQSLFKNNQGLSLTELLISVGLAGAIALGGAQLIGTMEKSKTHMGRQTEYLGLEKLIEGHLLSPKGCDALKNVAIGESFSFKTDPKSPTVYGKGQTIGGIEISELRIENFLPMSDGGESGIAQVELKLRKNNSSKEYRRILPVGVGVNGGVIQSCDYAQTVALTDATNNLCGETYGLASTMSCDEALKLLRNSVVENICTDLYGTKTPKYITDSSGLLFCNLALIHAEESCGAGLVQGINESGRVVCGSVSLGVPPASPPTSGPWTAGAWGACSESCGGGTQTRSVSCSFVNCTGARPSESQACNTQACGCPPGQMMHTNGCCYREIYYNGSDGQCEATMDTYCGEPVRDYFWEGVCGECAPAGVSCNPTSGPWTAGAWGACSESCGGGTQTRSVSCSFDSCTGARPSESQACNTQACSYGGIYKVTFSKPLGCHNNASIRGRLSPNIGRRCDPNENFSDTFDYELCKVVVECIRQ